MLKMGDEHIAIQRLRAALAGKPISYSTHQGRDEMSQVVSLVSGLLDLQKEDCLELIGRQTFGDVNDILRLQTPEQFKAYYIKKAQEREIAKGVKPVIGVTV